MIVVVIVEVVAVSSVSVSDRQKRTGQKKWMYKNDTSLRAALDANTYTHIHIGLKEALSVVVFTNDVCVRARMSALEFRVR